ncbi:MAG: hypothetical protein AB1772_00610 [Candidatus Zixiibacteriota bacterium]
MQGAASIVTPMALIALGDSLSNSLQYVKNYLFSNAYALAANSIFLIVDDEGHLCVVNGTRLLLDKFEDGAGDAPTKTTKPGCWQDNFRLFCSRAFAWSEALEAAEKDLVRRRQGEPSSLSGIVAPKRDLWLLATTYDPIGSAAIIPALQAHVHTQTVFLGRSRASCNLVLFAPKTVSDLRGRDAYCRTRSLFDELDDLEGICSRVGLRNLIHDSPSQVSIWIVSDRDDQDRVVAAPEALYSQLASIIELQQLGLLPADDSRRLGRQMASADTSKRLYNLFGVRRLSFPAADAISRALDKATSEAISTVWLSPASEPHPRQIAEEVASFLYLHEFHKLQDHLQLSGTPDQIGPAFEYSEKATLTLSADEHLARLKSEYEEYKNLNVPLVNARVYELRQMLLVKYRAIVDSKIREMIDSRARGVRAARAFLRALVGRSRQFAGTAALETPLDLWKIRDDIRARQFQFFRLADRRDSIQRMARDLLELQAQESLLCGEISELDDNGIPPLEREIKREAKTQRLSELRSRIRSLEEAIRTECLDQEQSEAHLDDVTWRRDFLSKRRQERWDNVIGPTFEELRRLDPMLSDLRSQQRTVQSIKEKRARRDFVLLPLLVSIGAIAASLLLMLFWIDAWGLLRGVSVYLIALSLVAVVTNGLVHQFFKLRPRLKTLRRQVETFENRYSTNLFKATQEVQSEFQELFDEFCMEETYRLLLDILVSEKRNLAYVAVIEERLNSEAHELMKSWDAFLGTLKCRDGNVAHSSYLNKLYDAKASELEAIKHRFSPTDSENPDDIVTSNVFFQSEGGTPAAAENAANRLIAEVRSRFKSVFASWGRTSIEEWLSHCPHADDDDKVELQKAVDTFTRSRATVQAQFVEEPNPKYIDEAFVVTHNTQWDRLGDITAAMVPNRRTPAIPHTQPNEILFVRRILNLQASETKEFRTADLLVQQASHPGTDRKKGFSAI